MSETKTAPTIYEALAAVKAAVGAVKKTGRNQQQGYNFRGVDAVVNAASPELNKQGVIVTPMLQSIDYDTVETGKNRTPMAHVRVIVTYRFHGPAGDHIDAMVPGESMDSGDKAAPKAMSVAYRIALLQALNLPTDDADPDSQTYERSPRGQSAGDAFDNATSSRPPQGNGNGRPAGQVSRPAQPEQRPAEPAAADDELMAAWGAKVDEIASQEDADKADGELKEVFRAGKIDATQANAIRRAIRDKAQRAGASA